MLPAVALERLAALRHLVERGLGRGQALLRTVQRRNVFAEPNRLLAVLVLGLLEPLGERVAHALQLVDLGLELLSKLRTALEPFAVLLQGLLVVPARALECLELLAQRIALTGDRRQGLAVTVFLPLGGFLGGGQSFELPEERLALGVGDLAVLL